MEAKTGGQA